MRKKERNQQIVARLEKVYKGAKPALHFSNPFELIVAVVLSAQCTDERVNKVTARLFPAYNTPEKMSTLTQEQLEVLIHDCGLFRSKAKNLLGLCRKLIDEYHSEVPQTMEELLSLPGVGRKTADVVLSVGFGKPAIAVDTHVFRVSHRLGLSNGTTPLAVEQDLQKQIPKAKWGEAHHWLIWHGRRVCKAPKPKCGECPLADLCPSQMAL
ncbi:MAG: endonuclease III [Acidaminococcus sp.]|jgi:endonuclease-3|nr:endonuclease III [Acidaminococcus sp.]MCI2100299.1 endonuclease III [Acidaminococcus sp.]MCI2114625.1 endonuclease III [Acidaminococcus sp.]MCI2116596.1 endonuclease III [Acidaminococcus sp.]